MAVLTGILLPGVSIGLLICGQGALWELRGKEQRRVLLAPRNGYRQFEPRFTDDEAYAPVQSPKRGLSPRPSLLPEVAVAAASLEQMAHERPSHTNQAALGVALLVTDRVDEAIETLESLRARDASGAWQSDLAAAYLVRHEASGSSLDAVKALDAARAALRIRDTLPEAQFNQALALESSHLADTAASAWQRYLHLDAVSPWADEARRHLGVLQQSARSRWQQLRSALLALEQPVDARLIAEAASDFAQATRELVEDDLLPHWAAAIRAADAPTAVDALTRAQIIASGLAHAGADPMLLDIVDQLSSANRAGTAALASAVATYASGKQALNATRYDAALASLRASSVDLSPNRNALSAWADIHAAFARYQTDDSTGARLEAERVATFARERGFKALLGRALWIQALALRREGRSEAAFQRSDEATRCFEAVHEHAQAGAVASTAADLARVMGEDRESWRLLGIALEATRTELSPMRRYLTFYNTALFAQHAGLTEASLVFQGEAIQAARLVRETGALAQAYTQRAMMEAVDNRNVQATQDLAAGRAELTSFTGGTKAYLDAEMNLLDATLSIDTDPARAQSLVAKAAQVIVPRSPMRTPELCLALGRTALRQADPEGARRALQRGVDYLETQRGRITDESLRIALFGTASDLYSELIQLALRNQDDRTVFSYGERSRARTLLDMAMANPKPDDIIAGAEDVRRVLPTGTALLEYIVLPDRVLAWVITPTSARLHSLSIARRALADATAVMRGNAPGRASEPPESIQDTVAERLYDALIRPLRADLGSIDRLLISPDGDLHGLPFAALRDRETRRRLLEDFVIQFTPSASWLTRHLATDTTAARPAPSHLLVIGNPAFDTRQYPRLSRLPDAEREAREIADLYPDPTVLIAGDATPTRLMSAIDEADVVHFAGHAVNNLEVPEQSYLLLAPDREGDAGRVRAGEIGRLPLRHVRFVVLAACRTGTGAVAFGEGELHLARAFLAAGVQAVLATLWDLDDAVAKDLLVDFHRHLRLGESVPEALQHAQLAMSHSTDPARRRAYNWTPFVVIGGLDQLHTPRKE